jgi:hypothetical protein
VGVIRITARHSYPDSTLAVAATHLDEAINRGYSIRDSLDRIAGSKDPFGEAMASAFCTGLGQVASQQEASTGPPDEEWQTFLVSQVSMLAPDSSLAVVNSKVSVFSNSVSLSQINPQLAWHYFRECGYR